MTFRRDMRKVFSPDHAELHAHIVRLSVLFEDMRVEVRGFQAVSIEKLDECSTFKREQYFIRRSFATLTEFAECIRRLNDARTSRSLELFSPGTKSILRFGRAVSPISIRTKRIIKRVRNDSGGHFGEAAARDVIELLEKEPEGLLGEITIAQDPKDPSRGGAIRLFTTIAKEFALSRHRGDK